MDRSSKKYKSLLNVSIAFLFLTGCLHKAKQTNNGKNIVAKENKKKNKKTKEQHVITIWIHGTRSHNIVNNFIKNVLFTDIFYRKIGLHPATSYEKKYNLRKIAENICMQNTERFVLENFYFFGWSGNLSHKKRKEAAAKLHKTTLTLINKYEKKHGITPKIRLITHSHGGNLACCLQKRNKKSKRKLRIYELILLACPVQKKTSHLLKDDMFETIYSLYSGLDIIQVIDPQGFELLQKYKTKQKRPFFSERRFAPQPNLTQVKLKINGRGILHVEFLLQKFTTLLPHILTEIDNWKKQDKANPYAYKKKRVLKVRIKNGAFTFRRKVIKRRYNHKKKQTTISEAVQEVPSQDVKSQHNQSPQTPTTHEAYRNKASS